jgi:hypothetical protein
MVQHLDAVVVPGEYVRVLGATKSPGVAGGKPAMPLGVPR